MKKTLEYEAEELNTELKDTLPSLPGQGSAILKEYSTRLRRPVSTLYVLADYNDPFYIGGIRERVVAAEWFARIWRQLDIPVGYHYRRIHYRMISQEPKLPFYKGGVYQNFNEHWGALNPAARDGVALGLLPLDAFVDRRNPEPFRYLAQPTHSEVAENENKEALLYRAGFTMPPLPCYGEFLVGLVPQRYHIEIWAEKSTMNDILVPLAQRYQVNLITGVGELSYTACRNFINRVRQSANDDDDDSKPVRIICISDFDPSGQNMPVSVARKIEFEIYRQGLDNVDVQVRPILLTHAQCVQYQLPRTPIKASDLRAPRFQQRFGEGATELDALEALHPGVFAQIVTREIRRYWNPNHHREVQEQIDEFKAQLTEIRDGVYAEHQEELDAYKAEIDRLNEQLRDVNGQAARLLVRMKPTWEAIARKLDEEEPEPGIECPEFEGHEDLNPLYDSTREYVEQIDRYKDYQGKPKARRPRQTTVRTPIRTTLRRPLRRGNEPPARPRFTRGN